jgi:hypothetical protein
MKKLPAILICNIILLSCATTFLVAAEQYRSPREINETLERISKQNKGVSALHNVGISPGGRDILILELGKRKEPVSSILVVANMEGNYPLASEAALELAQLLASDWADQIDNRTWYILPVGNPDGYAHFFERPAVESFLNAKSFNADNDDASDEDGPEDLNGDGYITLIRQAHPEGKWMLVEDNPVLLRKANRAKGQTGIYRLFDEGIDNDVDGEINEDGPGGINPGHNYPHNFEHYTTTDGLWAASESESRAVMEFAFDRPEVAMVIIFGRCNSLYKVPKSSGKAETGGGKIKVPERWADRLGLDPEKEMPLREITKMLQDYWNNPKLTEERVAIFMGAGAVTAIDKKDRPYWKEISERYNKFIEEAGLDSDRIDPPKYPPGSVDEWAYFQYGVPSFSMDFWTVPVAGEETAKDDTTEHEGMKNNKKGKNKEDEKNGADESELALFNYDSTAFVTWESYDHPTLGEVEIGGIVPYRLLAPPANEIDSLIQKQLPFVRKLAALLPEIRIDKVQIEKKGADIWKVEAWIVNRGFLPYPTYQGKRCRRPSPPAVMIEGDSFTLLEGRQRKVLGLLAGSGGVQKITWLLQAEENSRITLKLHTFSAGTDEQQVVLEGGK